MISVFYLHIMMRAAKILGCRNSQVSAGYCYKTAWRIRRIRVLSEITVYLPKSMNATLGRITNSLYLCDHVTSLTIIPECSLLCVELYSYWNDDEINVPYNRLSHNILRGLAISRLEIIAQHDFGVTKLSFLVYAVWGLCLINHVIESMPIRLLSVFITATLGNL